MSEDSIIVVGREKENLSERLNARRIFTPGEIREALKLEENTIWVARELPPLHEFSRVGHSRRRRVLLLLRGVDESRRAILETMFDQVVAPDGAIRLLEEAQLLEVVKSKQRSDYFIGGVYADEDDMLLLYRGDLRPLTLSMDWFDENPVANPVPEELELVDYGQGVRLGDYEVATRTILYEFDARYRRRQKENRRRLDDSLGGCLRRLRLMRGFKQNDFTSVTARTIRRIEKGEVDPRRSTIDKIAAELGVESDEITSY